MLAAILLLVAYLVVDSGDRKNTHLNILAEGVGICLSVVIAWMLIERYSQKQGQRIEEQAQLIIELATRVEAQTPRIERGVNTRLRRLQNFVSSSITNITTSIYDDPPFNQNQGGTWYIQNHYTELRQLLGIPATQTVRPYYIDDPLFEEERFSDPNRWHWILDNLNNTAKSIDRTIALFGPGLVEHHELLERMEGLQGGIEAEHHRWDRFWEGVHRQERAREERTVEVLRMGGTLADLEPRVPPVTPPGAAQNLVSIAADALGVVVAITYVLQDWQPMPPEEDVNLRRGAVWDWSLPMQ